MHISIDTSQPLSDLDRNVIRGLLGETTPSAVTVVNVGSSVADADKGKTSESEKPVRTRRTKAEMEAAAAAAQEKPAAAAETPKEETPAPALKEKPVAAEPGAEDLMTQAVNAATALVSTGRADEVKAALAKVREGQTDKVKRVSELKDDAEIEIFLAALA